MKAERDSTARTLFALVFGLFLGLCIWKFGNPVILDQKVSAPVSLAEYIGYSWPPHWVNWLVVPLTVFGAAVVLATKARWPAGRWLWLLPLLWLVWQFVSASRSVDENLTTSALWQFAGCVGCYFGGAFLIKNDRLMNWLLIGVLSAFVFCLIRAIDQRIVEFPQSRQMLLEGQRTGWTNFPPEVFAEMQRNGMIINTNGVDTINPKILDKFAKGRVMGTLVYPNALAGIILLLFPVSLAIAINGSKGLRPAIRAAVIVLTILLGTMAFFFSGSKLGWLIAVGMAGIYLLRLKWPMKLKIMALVIVTVLGLGVFAMRFHNYFSAGATSVSARFDYWRAAVETTISHPLLGTGPGTFQRPYAQLKSPESEMARLTHNDYLEQFCDSGIPGGLFYTVWIIAALVLLGRRAKNLSVFAILLGLLGWFAQGLGEFGLYVPGLAWTAFALLGAALAMANPLDKSATDSKMPRK